MSPIFDKIAFRRLRRLCGFKQPLPRVGRKTFIDRSAQFLGSELIEIGDRCIISEGCWFNVNDRTGDGVRIFIGDHCFVGRRAFFNCGSKITIGPYCMISNDCNILGSDHDFSDPFVPYIVPPTINRGEISIGANSWIGSGTTILKDVSIGFGSIIGAASLVKCWIPALSVAVGCPARVVKRFSVVKSAWLPISEWTKEDDEAVPCEAEYVRRLKLAHPWVSMPFVIAGYRRGNM